MIGKAERRMGSMRPTLAQAALNTRQVDAVVMVRGVSRTGDQ